MVSSFYFEGLFGLFYVMQLIDLDTEITYSKLLKMVCYYTVSMSYTGHNIMHNTGHQIQFVYENYFHDFHSNCDCLIFSCKIDWKKGKNITQKQVKKKQKHKGKS